MCLSNQVIAQHKNFKEHTSPAIRNVPDSVTERMKKEKEFLYANDPSFWEEQKPQANNAFFKLLESIGRSPLLKWLLYFFLAAIIIFAVYQVMVVNNFFIFTRTRSNKAQLKEEEELMPVNIDEKINEAIDKKEYRLAIRFLYLKTLQLLHDKNRIRMHAKSTNKDYIRQMQKHSGVSQFRLLTRIYEYVWYGDFHPNDHQFQIINTNFNQFISLD
jgi:hypothetical protein